MLHSMAIESSRMGSVHSSYENMSRMQVVKVDDGCVEFDTLLGIDMYSSYVVEFRLPGCSQSFFLESLPRTHMRDDIASVRSSWYRYLLQHDLINRPIAPWDLGSHLFAFAYENHILSKQEIDFVLPRMIFQELVGMDEVFSTAMAFFAYRERRYEAAVPPPKLSEIMEKTRDLSKCPCSTSELIPGACYQPEGFLDAGIFSYSIARMKINSSYLKTVKQALPHAFVDQFESVLRRLDIWDREIDMISLGKALASMYRGLSKQAHHKKMFVALLTTMANVSFCSFVELLFTFYFEEKIYRSS